MKKLLNIFALFAIIFSTILIFPNSTKADSSTDPFSLRIRWGYLEKKSSFQKSNFDGYVELVNGRTIQLQKTVLFERAHRDSITSLTSNKVEWLSDIASHNDGIIIKISPSSLSQAVNIKTGSSIHTFTISQLKGLSQLLTVDGQGHQLEIKDLSLITPLRIKMLWGNQGSSSPASMPVTKWNGNISSTNINAKLFKTIRDESKDSIWSNGSNAYFSTITKGGRDGLIYEIPTIDPGSTVTFTVKTGTYSFLKTYTVEELKTLHLKQIIDQYNNGYTIDSNF